MHVLSWILTGLLTGWIARTAIGTRRYGLFGDLSLGVLGAVIGGWLFRLLGVTPPDAAAAHFVMAALGALSFVAAMQIVLRATDQAVKLAGAERAHARESLGALVGRLGEFEQGILTRFLRREPVARDPSVAFTERLGLGARAADRLASFGGSWIFLGLFAAILISWLVYNVERPDSFDPYPFILLNLVLSCLAAAQAPVILMSQNRLAERDRIHAHLDYEVNLKAEMEILALHEKLDALRGRAWEALLELEQRQLELLERIERGRSGADPSET